jgi:gamma-glutamyltranspeptidase/glutathione hydrolase
LDIVAMIGSGLSQARRRSRTVSRRTPSSPRPQRKHCVVVVLALLSCSGAVIARQQPVHQWTSATYKQEVVAARGVVATNHPLASAAGQLILALGGNAFDAMIAAFFALSVVEPAMVSPFGAGFVNLRTASGQSITIDNYSVAPAAATPNLYRLVHPDDERAQAEALHATVGQENSVGSKAVGVPGNLKAWLWVLKHHGSRNVDFRDVVAPAIRYARDGVPLSAAQRKTIVDHRERMQRFGGWTEQFLPGGTTPEPGSVFARPGYAGTLEVLVNAAPTGADFDAQLEAAGRSFYTGEIGRNVVDYVRATGGVLSLDDLAWYWGKGVDDTSDAQGLRLRTPVRSTYRGHDVIAMPPTSSGGTHVIQILNILEGYDLKALGFANPRRLHLVTEAMKIAWADRDAYMGDPDYAGKDPSYAYKPPPVSTLVDKAYAARRRQEIRLDRAGSFKAGALTALSTAAPAAAGPQFQESANTTHVTAMDADGNIITATQTLNGLFGSGVAMPGRVPGSGMLLDNTMALFDPDPRPGYERANAVAPRKRPLSSMSPTILLKDGKPFVGIGTPGGTRIYSAVLQGILNVVDHGMTIQQAVEAPRLFAMMFGALNVEEGFPDSSVAELERLGHKVERVRTVAGGMNGVLRDPVTGMLHGGACWRGDGSVAGWSGGDALPPTFKFPPVWRPQP